MNDMQSTGNIIKERRMELKLSQRQLAELVGVQPSTISRWETGNGYPDQSIIGDLARELGLTVDELLGVDEEQVAKPKRKKTFKEMLGLVMNTFLKIVFISSILLYTILQERHFEEHQIEIYYTPSVKWILCILMCAFDVIFLFIKPAREWITRFFYKAKYKHKFPAGYDFEVRNSYYIFMNCVLLLITGFVLFVM